MLEKISQKKMKKAEALDSLKEMREQLIDLANRAKADKLPVIITIDGWSAAGKGVQIASLIKYMDPRFYDVESVRKPNVIELRKPWLHRYWQKLPKQGNFLILDGSWYRDTVNALNYGEIDKAEYKRRINDINTFERQLADDGYLIVKLFLHITDGEQLRRLEKLASSEITRWRVDEQDMINNKNYANIFKRYDKTFTRTNTAFAPWHIRAPRRSHA